MDKKRVMIGWASADVTPDCPVALQGQRYVRIAETVNDPLTVTALAVSSEDSADMAVMVSLDAVSIKDEIKDECRQRLASEIPDLPPEKFFIFCTHTHTAPVQPPSNYPPLGPEVKSPEAYADLLVQQITACVTEAWHRREPGGVAWGFGEAVVGHNRRITRFSGESKMYGNPDDPTFSHIEGFEDHGVDMLFTYNAARELTGMVLNLACPAQCVENFSMVSADFWHDAREEIRRRRGDGIFVLPQCSAAGDQSPHPILHKAARERMWQLEGIECRDKMQQRAAERPGIGKRIADAVDDVLPVAEKDIRESVVLEHQVKILDIPMRIVAEEDRRMAEEQVAAYKEKLEAFANKDPRDADYTRTYAMMGVFQRVIDRCRRGEKTLPVETHFIRLGDVAFASNRFEYFLDFGLRIKSRSNAVQTFVIQLAGPGSYVPTQRAVAGKSYGAGVESNLVGPEGGQEIAEESVAAINSMFG